MYLSRLVLNQRSRQVRADLADCQALHRSVLCAFPTKNGDRGAREEFGVLYRLEPSCRGSAPVLLVQSLDMPDWARFPPDYLISPAATRSLATFFDSLQPGDTLRFRLRANPTKKVDTKSGPNGERRNGRRVKLKTEAEQVAWLQRKATAEGSFEILSVRAAPETAALDVTDEGQLKGWKSQPEGSTRRLTFGTVLFDGHLQVADPKRFRRTVERGLGSGKAYGFGLLSTVREENTGRR